jgi:hypothetical protein
MKKALSQKDKILLTKHMDFYLAKEYEKAIEGRKKFKIRIARRNSPPIIL